MGKLGGRLTLLLQGLSALAASSQPGSAASNIASGVTLELNKLEAHDKGCRAYFVVDNPGAAPFQTLKVDLIFFGGDGIIARRLVIDFGPFRAAKKTVKTFDMDTPRCSGIGSLLLNDALECKSANAPIVDCLQHLNTTSRNSVSFSK